MRRSAFFLRVIGIGILFHIYVGMRLIPAAPVGAPLRWLGVLMLIASVLVIPLGMAARTIESQPLSDRLAWIGLIALGLFSSLLVLTLLRDVVLLVVASRRLGALARRSVARVRRDQRARRAALAVLVFAGRLVQRAAARARRRPSTCRSTICPPRCTASRSRRSATSTSGRRSSAATSTHRRRRSTASSRT